MLITYCLCNDNLGKCLGGGILDLRDRWGFDGNLSCLGKDLCGKREG